MTVVLKSFIYFKDELDSVLMCKIYDAIDSSKFYFRKYCGVHSEEAMHLSLMHALTHYSEDKGDLGAYVRSLALTILRDRYSHNVSAVDFLESSVANDISTNESYDVESIVLEGIMEDECYKKVVDLALTSMGYFSLMCEAILRKDATTLYFPEYFISETLKLSAQFKNFNGVCLDLYTSYKDKMLSFLLDDSGTWQEANFTIMSKYTSTRVALVSNKTGKVSKDPDSEDCIVRGSMEGKRVVSIGYKDALDSMCDLIDEDGGINAMRFSIDDSYIIRTLGGSLSVLNPSLFCEYDLCKAEIITNLIKDTRGRLLCVGSERMYFLVADVKEIPKREVRGVVLDFDVRVEL